MWKGLCTIDETALLQTTLDNNYVDLLSHRFYKSKETSNKFSNGVLIISFSSKNIIVLMFCFQTIFCHQTLLFHIAVVFKISI